jgi:hypothetical protein
LSKPRPVTWRSAISAADPDWLRGVPNFVGATTVLSLQLIQHSSRNRWAIRCDATRLNLSKVKLEESR